MTDRRRWPAGGTFRCRRLSGLAAVAQDAADGGSPILNSRAGAQRRADDDFVVHRAHVPNLIERGDLGFRPAARILPSRRLVGLATNVSIAERDEPLDRVGAPVVQ